MNSRKPCNIMGFITLILLCCICLCSCNNKKIDSSKQTVKVGKSASNTISNLKEQKELLKLEDFNGQPIGVLTGSLFDQIVSKYFPDSKKVYFNTSSDELQALRSGTIKGYVDDYPTAYDCSLENEDIAILKDIIETTYFAFAFAKSDKGKAICDELSAYILNIKENGKLQELNDKWFQMDESKRQVEDYTLFPADKGTLKVAVDAANSPFNYLKNDRYVGYEVNILVDFCKEKGYALDIDGMDFDALIPGIVSERYDIASGSIGISEERKESVNFSEPNYDSKMIMVCEKEDLYGDSGLINENKSIIKSLKDSLEKNFIREHRWKMIFNGLWITIVISAFSAVFGSALGFAVCYLRRMKNTTCMRIAVLYVRVIQGIPMLVLLMILYYIIFNKSPVPSVVVAIIGFSINFSAYVSEMIRIGIEAVDIGQTEAALSLGYSRQQTFWKYILPQAAKHFLPVYKGELVSMIKMTSIVGYIAIEDLTKVSDIIRSRTYEAFFPLILTAVIYFIISGLMTSILTKIEISVDPKRRNGKNKKMENIGGKQ